jgi:hypothetical protein
MNNLPAITGRVNITLQPLRTVPAGPPHTYLGMARQFLEGAEVLATSMPGSAVSLAFLVAQATECALKAFLSRSGDDKRLKNPQLRHDLIALWSLAAEEGMQISIAPPAWVSTLAHLHAAPYYLRYSTGVHGLVLPASEPMTSELAIVVEQASKQI